MAASTKQTLEPAQRGALSSIPRLEQELERFFGNRFPNIFDWSSRSSLFDSAMPSVDVIDKENEVCVRVEIPGFKKKEVDISVNDRALTIKAESKSESKEEDGDYHRREIAQGYLVRTVELPAEVDGDKAKASLEDGILSVTVPKVARSKRKRVKID